MKDESPYSEEHRRRVAASRKRTASFRKANPKEKGKLISEGRLGRNFLFPPPAKDEGLAFVENYFAKAIEKPHAELAAITETWEACAPDYAKGAAQLTGFKRGTLDILVSSSAVKYKLEMDLRTGLEQRLRAAHKGETLKKVKVSVGAAARKAETDADKAENEALRRVRLSEVMKAAGEGRL